MVDCENNEDDFEKIKSEEDDENEDNSTYDIISYGADFTLSVLYDKMEKEEISIPDFQRRFVWNIKQASKLIESFLLGLPIPGVFFAKEKGSGNLLVIDGQQRLVTCKAFRDEIFPIKSEDFTLRNVNKKWEGKKYSELSPVDRKRFDDSVLRATIIQQISPNDNDTSTYHIFQRLNTGGTALQNQEVRNCVYHGKFNDLLNELNEDKIWRGICNNKEPHKRMKDVELILRFLALYYNFNNYTKPMNEFLSNFMKNKKNADNKTLDEMKIKFIETISFVNKTVGHRAFRPRGPINANAFDSVMYVIAKNKSNLKDKLDEQILKLFDDVAYLKAISDGTTDPETIKARLSISKRYLVKQ